jgi:radical SAM superfamily enzyme YgiQ (UPF0313 family)
MAAKLDVVFVNPASRRRVYQSLARELAAVEPPVWARLLAAYCVRRGLHVAIVDAEADESSPDEVADAIDQLRPTLVAVVVYGHQPSASTQNMTAAGDVCRAIKGRLPEQKVILVGGHVAALPERTLREECADFVAGGEGFATTTALVEALQSPTPALAGVPGLWYRDHDDFRANPDVPLVNDLESEVPSRTGWDLLPMGKYRAHNWHCLGGLARQPYAAIYTTLGCPYHCSFCCIQAPFREGEKAAGLRPSINSYRFWSAEAVLDQIDLLVNHYSVRNLKIADEMFVLNRRHVLAICRGIIERKYDLNLWAYARVDTVKDDLLGPLRDAGFTWLALGIEAGDQRVRANVDKRFHQDEIFEVVGKIRAAGINVIGNYIFGLPDDDTDTMEATLDLAQELNCEFANFYATMAYPGSALYTQAIQQNIPLPRTWAGYAQHARECLPLPTRHLTARDVLAFRDDAFVRYYAAPGYIDTVARRFGPAAAEDIRGMTQVRLQRDLLEGRMDVPPVRLPNGSPVAAHVNS